MSSSTTPRKRKSVYDLMDGSFAKIKGLSAAAATAKDAVLLRSEEPAPYGVIPQAHLTPTPETETLGHTRPDSVRHGQTMSGQITPCQTRSDHAVRPSQTRTNQVKHGQIWSDHHGPAEHDKGSDQVRPSQTRFTRHERTVLAFVEEVQERVIRTKTLAKSLDMSLPTLYKIIRRLRDRGHIQAEKDGNDGTYLKFISRDLVISSQTKSDQVRPSQTKSCHSLPLFREKDRISIYLS